MSPPGLDPRPWPRSRWYLLITVVFAGQIGLIFAVSDRKPMEVRQPEYAPKLRLPAVTNELLALTDPTLFVLPSANGFSADAWLGTNGFSADAWLEPPTHAPHAFEWREPDRWLPPPAAQFGGVLAAFMQTNRLHIGYEITRPQEPQIYIASATPPPPPQTRLSVDGDLASRHLLGLPRLPVFPYADVLQDSTVQVFVDEAGNVVTTALLPPGSGSDPADQQALRLARTVRFALLPHEEGGQVHWTRGSLVFRWATIPVSTNAPPATP